MSLIRKIQCNQIQTLKLIEIIHSNKEYASILPADFHNFFTLYRDGSSEELKKMKKIWEESPENKPDNYGEFLDIIVHFTEQYDYYTPNQLLRKIREIIQENKRK